MEAWTFFSAVAVLLCLVDDLFIDIMSVVFRLKPEKWNLPESLAAKRRRKLAIMVANWKEYEVLEAMVRANSGFLQDGNIHLFLGVYPNDVETREVAKKMATEFEQVHCVINRTPGPTYKGQMLDEVIDGILDYEKEAGFTFEGFILHDSEDLIDPRSLDVYSSLLQHYDFIQTPVLSFNLPSKDFVGATYMDEFAESHSKDMLVRERLGGGVPSAGVGTCLGRVLTLFFKRRQGGKLFPKKDLTEDYVLGLNARRYGFRSKFACFETDDGNGLISTREFFPNEVMASIRQKSRWTLGIGFQGWMRLGWFGSIPQRYFLWRDRKILMVPMLTLNCLALLLVTSLMPERADVGVLDTLLSLNIYMIGLRLVFRGYWVSYHHGPKQAALMIVRWPLAIFINTSACLVAIRDQIKQTFFGLEVKWKKTTHKFIEPVVYQKRTGS